jgi:hypothetical protein
MTRTSQVTISQRKRGRAVWPVIGFILALALAVIGYLLAPAILDLLRSASPSLRGALRTLPVSQLQLIVAGVMFLIGGSIAALIVAAAAPKPKSEVTYKEVSKEREAMMMSRKRDKVQQRLVNRQYREQTQKKNSQN